MSDDTNFFLDPKIAALIRYDFFFRQYTERYSMILDIYHVGTNKIRKHISNQIKQSGLQNDNGGYPEDEFIILDELDKVNSHIFKVYTLVSMYSESEIALKEWLRYLHGSHVDAGTIGKLKKKYKDKEIDLPSLGGYEDFNCLRLLNNCIKHKGSIADRCIHCVCLNRVFNSGVDC